MVLLLSESFIDPFSYESLVVSLLFVTVDVSSVGAVDVVSVIVSSEVWRDCSRFVSSKFYCLTDLYQNIEIMY